MMTKQNDTAALTDEQLEGVAGGMRPLPSPGRRVDQFRRQDPL